MTGRRSRAIELLAGCCGLVLAAPVGSHEARAAEGVTRIAVVRQAGANAAMNEIATRAWAELTAAGFRADLVDCPDERSCRREPARPNELLATVATFGRDDQTVVEIDIAGAGTSPRPERTVVGDSGEPANPRVIAIQVVERVRAALLRTRAKIATEVATKPATKVATPAAATTSVGASNDDELPVHLIPARRQRKWALGAGPTVLETPGGLGRGFGAVVRADYFLLETLGAALTVGAARGSDVQAAAGALALQQSFAVLELVRRFFPGARLRPLLSLGAGACHVAADFAPDVARGTGGSSDSLWSFLLSSGAGAELSVGGGLNMFVDARALFANPRPAVATPAGGVAAARNPSFLFSLGIGKTF